MLCTASGKQVSTFRARLPHCFLVEPEQDLKYFAPPVLEGGTMRKCTVTLLALTLVLSAVAFAGGEGKGSGKEAQQVEKLINQGREAAVKGDTNFLEQHLSNDYVGVNAFGQAMTKQEIIEARKQGKLKYESIEPREQKIHLHGNTAVVAGQYSVKGTREGQDITGDYRVTQTWVKEGGAWKQVSFQSTPVRTTATASK
jgi:ketosteroid isomerase-like protein